MCALCCWEVVRGYWKRLEIARGMVCLGRVAEVPKQGVEQVQPTKGSQIVGRRSVPRIPSTRSNELNLEVVENNRRLCYRVSVVQSWGGLRLCVGTIC